MLPSDDRSLVWGRKCGLVSVLLLTQICQGLIEFVVLGYTPQEEITWLAFKFYWGLLVCTSLLTVGFPCVPLLRGAEWLKAFPAALFALLIFIMDILYRFVMFVGRFGSVVYMGFITDDGHLIKSPESYRPSRNRTSTYAAYIGINSFALYFDFKAERFMNLFVLFSTALDLIEKFNAGLTPEEIQQGTDVDNDVRQCIRMIVIPTLVFMFFDLLLNILGFVNSGMKGNRHTFKKDIFRGTTMLEFIFDAVVTLVHVLIIMGGLD